jgi:hypothetical protein
MGHLSLRHDASSGCGWRRLPPDMRTALSTLSKQSRTACKGWSSSVKVWRLTVAFRTFIRIYSLFKSERLSAKIKLTLHKALISSVMTYASPAWEFAADTHLTILQRLQNKVLRTIGNLPRRTPVRELHLAFKLLYVCDTN